MNPSDTPNPNRPNPTPPDEPDLHERFLALVEMELRHELSEAEREELDRYLASSEHSRTHATEARKEHQTMFNAIENVRQYCDFARVERAIMNQKARERVMIRISLIMMSFGVIGATLTYLFNAPPAMIFGFSMLVIGTAAHWLIHWYQIIKWRAFAERCRAGDPIAEARFERSVRTCSTVQEISLLLMIIGLPIMGMLGIYNLIAGNWWYGGFFTTCALISLPVLPILCKQLFSRKQRAFERAVTSGEISDNRFTSHDAQPDQPDKPNPK